MAKRPSPTTMTQPSPSSPPSPPSAPSSPTTCNACGSAKAEPLAEATFHPIDGQVHAWQRMQCACGQVRVDKSVRAA